ncbi:hypothetical protein CPAR01_08361 [Colletotrichum paranaense]|uniref:Uncharacterized protein n=1 Tax=Colletotrichum paranaense TaxID=1914294 RepID=A0ABQ9SK39_9PEZI|nr:uncharacterized protein CPAR01_08361 [Colletotrichum paranaense]KAK1538248.1 hypothetical protein CPAR01_08361 [Colletotrichum paranaense]
METDALVPSGSMYQSPSPVDLGAVGGELGSLPEKLGGVPGVTWKCVQAGRQLQRQYQSTGTPPYKERSGKGRKEEQKKIRSICCEGKSVYQLEEIGMEEKEEEEELAPGSYVRFR